jgi:sterol-4alpha-carboxylate 3-dehydrogenase (decarboxylating)
MVSEKKPALGYVMVIGGCGFLGHHVVRLLLRDYACTVSVIDLRCTRNRRPDSDGVTYYEADITDADKLEAIFQKAQPDVVIHTASPAAQSNDSVSHALFKKVNVDGTAAVVKACQKTGVKALVYTSSASVMSDNQSDLINADERWPLVRGKNQSEYYSETKVRRPCPNQFKPFSDPSSCCRPPPKKSSSPRTAPPNPPSSSHAPSGPRASWARATPWSCTT